MIKNPSRGRLFKLFTEMGPYFRIKKSSEKQYFYDCLDICLDAEKGPELRSFYGWWMTVSKEDDQFVFERFDGLFNLAGEWELASLSSDNKAVLDDSFNLFVTRLQALLKLETGLSLVEQGKHLTAKKRVKKTIEKTQALALADV